MKKSFLGKVLMMASFVAILGGFSSCKDYSEDRYSDLLGKLENQNSSLNDALDAQKNELLAQIADLEAAQQACKEECEQKMKELKDNLNDAKNEWNKNLASEVATLTAVDANLQSQIDAINALLGSNTSGKTVIEQINEVNQAAANAAANAASALEQLKTVNATTADFEERIKALESWKTEVDALIVGWSEEVKKVAEDAAKALADAKANAERIEVMETLAQDQAEKLDSIADAMNGYASKEELEKVAEQAAKIDDVIEELKDLATKQELEEVKALAEANFVAAKAYTDEQIAFVIKTFNKKFNDVNDNIDELENAFGELDAAVDALTDAMKDSLNNINESLNALRDSLMNTNAYLSVLEDYVDVLASEIDDANLKISDLEAKMDSVDAVLAARLDKVEKDVEAVKAQVDANTAAINNLTDAFKKLITSVIIQGTKNPITGSWATPFNTRSNILAAYYGYAGAAGVKFPTELPRFYADNANVLMTAKDLEMLNVTPITVDADAMILGGTGNAGTLYLTVNPNTVDFSNTKFSLVNSQDEFSGVTLSGIEKSDAVLNFGFSRAANNGFYEAKATVAKEDVEDLKLAIDLGEIKEVAKDIVDGNGISVSGIATTMYNTLSAFNLEANGVKASWTDAEGEHSTYSQYAVAATVVKPLSYAFGKDFNFTSVPGVDRVENFIGTMSDKVYNKLMSYIPDFSGMSFTAPTINKITIPTLNPDDCKVTFVVDINTTVEYELNMTVPIEDVKINDMNGSTESIKVKVPEKTHSVVVEKVVGGSKVTENQDITIPEYEIEVPSSNFVVNGQTVQIKDVQIKQMLNIPVKYTYTGEQNIYDVVNKLYGNITGSIEGVNDMLDQLDSFMDDVNSMLDELNKIKDVTNKVEDVKDALVSQITKYLDIFNNKFCSLVNSTNDALQPVMFVKTTDGFSKLSQTKGAPTMFSNGSVILIPTSYTAEILAPAYKKLVGVTNVINGSASAQAGNADCVAALKKVNAQTGVAEILAGDTYAVSATFEAGYIYEVVYTAVDFHGVVNTKKFYVTVK